MPVTIAGGAVRAASTIRSDPTPEITQSDLGIDGDIWTYRGLSLGVQRDRRLLVEALDRAWIIQRELDRGDDPAPFPLDREVCAECGDLIFDSQGCECEYPRCIECGDTIWNETDDPDYCAYCFDDMQNEVSDLVHGYSTKLDWQFHGSDSQVYLGAELEIESPSNMNGVAELASAHLGGLGLLKEDGSLSWGFEIVTHPMTYRWALENYPWPMLAALAAAGASCEETCGLHIHVSRAGFSDAAHVYRWLAFVHRNPRPIQALAGRGSVNYARWSDDFRDYMADYAKGSRDSSRYVAINAQNPDTFEMRFFAGSLDADTIRAAFAFADASIEYTRQLTLHDILHNDGWSFAAFFNWVAEKDHYAPLVKHVRRSAALVILEPQAIRPAKKTPGRWTGGTFSDRWGRRYRVRDGEVQQWCVPHGTWHFYCMEGDPAHIEISR